MADDSNGQEYDGSMGGGEKDSKYDPKTTEYLQELLREKRVLNTATFPHASRLMQEELSRTQQTGRAHKDYRYADVYRERPTKVTVKVAVPIREHPKFNFVGKLLGPKGNSLKRLQEETLCRMAILGRGSMKDKAKEEELRNSLDPKFAHLSDDLHIEISALAGPAEAYARIAYALAEVRKYLIPDCNDEISHGQLREMETFVEVPDSRGGVMTDDGSYKRPLLRTPRGGGRGGGRGAPMRGGSTRPHWSGQNTMRKAPMEKDRSSYDYGFGRQDESEMYGEEEEEYYDTQRPDRYSSHSGYSGYSGHSGGQYGNLGDNSRGRWKATSSNSSRFVARSAPYNRPHKAM